MSAISPLSRLQELLPQLFQSTQLPTGDRYLRFGLTSESSALMSMESVKESLLVAAEQITPLPNMPEAVMGLLNSRDQVFCVIDLAQFLGMSPLSAYGRQYHIVVVRVSPSYGQQSSSEKELLLGIAVKQVQGITRLSAENFQLPISPLPPSLNPYLHGCVIEQEEQLLVLDMGAVVTAPSLYGKIRSSD